MEFVFSFCFCVFVFLLLLFNLDQSWQQQQGQTNKFPARAFAFWLHFLHFSLQFLQLFTLFLFLFLLCCGRSSGEFNWKLYTINFRSKNCKQAIKTAQQ